MVSLFRRIFGMGEPKETIPTVDIEALDPFSPTISTSWDGEKFPTGFGPTDVFEWDYDTLRARSRQLFAKNKYAKGLIKRLLTNEINTGLSLKCTPEESLLGMSAEQAADWSEDVETRFRLWGNSADSVDYSGQMTFGEIQRQARLEALIAGDVLIVLRTDPVTKLPIVQLVNGDRILTPAKFNIPKGHRIEHGVQLDAKGRHVAYYYEPIQPDNGPTLDVITIPARGRSTGRRTAWLVYGTPKLMNNVRGEPLLSVILQGLKEIDRFKDATIRKAVVNSILAMFVEKTKPGMGSKPISTGAARKSSGTVETAAGPRTYNIAQQVPGFIVEEMQEGETIKPGSVAGTDVNFGPFEAAMLSAIAWSMEIPPEILTLSFSSNYSASQAALNEFKMYLNAVRWLIGQNELQPIYEEWLLSSVFTGKIKADGIIGAWQSTKDHEIYQAWVSANWNGAIKPSMDQLKMANAYDKMISMGAITRHKTSLELSGTNFIQNTKQLERENVLLAKALRPILELKKEFGEQVVSEEVAAIGRSIDSIESELEEIRDAG